MQQVQSLYDWAAFKTLNTLCAESLKGRGAVHEQLKYKMDNMFKLQMLYVQHV